MKPSDPFEYPLLGSEPLGCSAGVGAVGEGDILSCVVDTHTGRGPEIAAQLADLAGVEVHGGAEAGRLVVTIEDGAGHTAIDRLGEISVIPGVMAAILVYHCDGRALHEPEPVGAS